MDEWQGRQDEINELQTALSNDKVRLIGMTAAGGYGKSALAVKFTQQLTPNWRVLWVSFIQPYPLAQFGRWLLEQLGRDYDEKWDEETLIGQIIAGLIAEPCLLVLDNMETVIPAEGKSVYGQFLSQWLGNGSNSKLLLTSREQPTLAPNLLPRCYWLPLKGLAEADAIRLVTEDYGLTGTEKELAHFVNQMGRHPLLMQLVSSWMREELGKGICVTEAENLGLDLFTVEGYHRDDAETSVGKVVTASLARLSARLGDILKRLSVLRGIFELGLAQGLTAEVTEAELRYLARLSLLQEFPPEPKEGKRRRFEFLPLIKAFVQQQADSEVLRSAHQSALDYFLAHLPSPPWESLEDLTAYLEGFYHAGELGEWQLAFDILNEERGGEGKKKSVDQFFVLQGLYCQRLELYKSWPLEEQQQSSSGNILNNLGNCYYSLGEYQEVIACYKKSLNIARKSKNRWGIANSLNNIGSCYHLLENHKRAIKYFEKSLKIKEKIGNQLGITTSLQNLGNCHYSLGEYQEALTYYEKSLEINNAISNDLGIASSLWSIGEILIKQEKYLEAEINIQKALKIVDQIGFQVGKANIFKVLAEIADKTNRPVIALNYCQQALELSQQLDIPLVKDCEELLAQIQATLKEN